MSRVVRQVNYEWDIESLDEYGDIIDHRHSDVFPGIPTGDNESLVLVRDTAEGISGEPSSFDLKDRTRAYTVDGVLPQTFDDGTMVPMRFFKEMSK